MEEPHINGVVNKFFFRSIVIKTMAIDRKTTEIQKEMENILDWVKSCDPSIYHESARIKHEPS